MVPRHGGRGYRDWRGRNCLVEPGGRCSACVYGERLTNEFRVMVKEWWTGL